MRKVAGEGDAAASRDHARGCLLAALDDEQRYAQRSTTKPTPLSGLPTLRPGGRRASKRMDSDRHVDRIDRRASAPCVAREEVKCHA